MNNEKISEKELTDEELQQVSGGDIDKEKIAEMLRNRGS